MRPPQKEGVIVVTAQKRAENVQDVPISIAAFSGDTLEKDNVVNIEGLAKITPNLSVARGAQTSYVRLAIRGIGAASNTTVEPRSEASGGSHVEGMGGRQGHYRGRL